MPEHSAPWVEPVRQRLRAWRTGQLLLDTCRAHLYFPDERHPRWAVPAGDLLGPAPGAFTHDGLAVLSPGDVAWALLEPDPARTTCQYKRDATYFRVRDSDVRLWTYRHPDPEAAAIAGHVAAAAEHPGVHITIDGTPETQP